MVDLHERETPSGHAAVIGDADAADDDQTADDAGQTGGGGSQREGREPGSDYRDGDADHHDEGGPHEHTADHHDHAAGHHDDDLDVVGAAVVTVSTSRTLEEDPSGDAIVEAFEAAGHAIATRELVADDRDNLEARVDALVGRDDVDVVVTTGGTGVSPDDVTVEAVEPLFEKRLPGFGELFRRRSEADIGNRVVATRAAAGIADGVPVFCLPGSEAAARLGAGEVIVPVVGHLAGLARRDEDEEE